MDNHWSACRRDLISPSLSLSRSHFADFTFIMASFRLFSLPQTYIFLCLFWRGECYGMTDSPVLQDHQPTTMDSHRPYRLWPWCRRLWPWCRRTVATSPRHSSALCIAHCTAPPLHPRPCSPHLRCTQKHCTVPSDPLGY